MYVANPQNDHKCQTEIIELLQNRTSSESVVQTVLRLALAPTPWQDAPLLHSILYRLEAASERAIESTMVPVSCYLLQRWSCMQFFFDALHVGAERECTVIITVPAGGERCGV